MKNTKNKQPKTVIQRDCQYQLPNCQKIAIAQRVLKLGAVTIDKGWICDNCQENIEKERKQSPTAVFERLSKKKQK